MCINEEVNNMNSISGFSDSAVKALNSALGAAMGYGHTYVGSEHMLYGLVSDDSFPSASVLRRYGVGRNEVLRRLETLVGKEYWPFPTYDDLLFNV